MDGSPPGLPGGGITGMLPVFGAFSWMSGSTPGGGHNTPSDFASLSLRGSLVCPVVALPRGAMVPSVGTARVGAQFAVAVGAGGVAGAGGACATDTVGDTASRQTNAMDVFRFMVRKRMEHRLVPAELSVVVCDAPQLQFLR
jgi:hypothetical protein